MTTPKTEIEHQCRRHLPRPRRWRLTQVRACRCGRLYHCQIWGHLAPQPTWLPVFFDLDAQGTR